MKSTKRWSVEFARQRGDGRRRGHFRFVDPIAGAQQDAAAFREIADRLVPGFIRRARRPCIIWAG